MSEYAFSADTALESTWGQVKLVSEMDFLHDFLLSQEVTVIYVPREAEAKISQPYIFFFSRGILSQNRMNNQLQNYRSLLDLVEEQRFVYVSGFLRNFGWGTAS